MNTKQPGKGRKAFRRIQRKGSRFCCGFCSEELDVLSNCCNADEIFTVYMLSDGSLNVEQVDVVYATEGEEMLCPYCKETLGPWDEKKAGQILSANSKSGGTKKCTVS